jgi:ribonuclease Z
MGTDHVLRGAGAGVATQSIMTRLVQPSLVNEPFSDPGLFLDFRFGRRRLLFDLGDLTPLSPRQLLRVTHAFVSHTRMDHFAGFDRLLRVCLHRTTPLHLIGPVGFADRVEHKLKAYTLNLLDAESVDFVIVAAEFSGAGFERVCEFRAREAFRRREKPAVRLSSGLLLDEEEFRVEGTVLDHGIPCLAFAFEEKLRVNVWREGLRRLGLPVGPWLREAKRAVRQGASDHSQVCVRDGLAISLGDLKQYALRTARGQKIAYVVDLVYDEQNVEKAQQPTATNGQHSITVHNKAMLNSYTMFSCSNKGCQFARENTVAEPAPLPRGNSGSTVRQSVTGEVGPGQQPATVTVPAPPTPMTKE